MRIAEIAEIAGVTVRTVRHYHQVGALPEPPRRSNGYRDYTVDHLVTLLRIVQLTDSGLTLAQAGALVAETSESADAVLDEVDRSLEEQITALSGQRRRLAQARSSGHVGLSRVAAALSISSADTPSAILFAHLYKDDPQFGVFADVLLEPDLRSSLALIQERFEAIDETSTEEELERLAAFMRSIVPELADDVPPLTHKQSQLVLELIERGLNDRQKAFLRSQL